MAQYLPNQKQIEFHERRQASFLFFYSCVQHTLGKKNTCTRSVSAHAYIYTYRESAHSSAHPRTSLIFARHNVSGTFNTCVFICKNDRQNNNAISIQIDTVETIPQGSITSKKSVTNNNKRAISTHGFATCLFFFCFSDAGACEEERKKKKTRTVGKWQSFFFFFRLESTQQASITFNHTGHTDGTIFAKTETD